MAFTEAVQAVRDAYGSAADEVVDVVRDRAADPVMLSRFADEFFSRLPDGVLSDGIERVEMTRRNWRTAGFGQVGVILDRYPVTGLLGWIVVAYPPAPAPGLRADPDTGDTSGGLLLEVPLFVTTMLQRLNTGGMTVKRLGSPGPGPLAPDRLRRLASLWDITADPWTAGPRRQTLAAAWARLQDVEQAATGNALPVDRVHEVAVSVWDDDRERSFDEIVEIAVLVTAQDLPRR
jgi:hypothetical protein